MKKENKNVLQVPEPGSLVTLQNRLKNCIDIISSTIKICILSRKTTRPENPTGYNEVIVLGNGPSAKDFLEQKQDFLKGKALLAVNFFSRSPHFTETRPSLYVVADPAFFLKDTSAGIFDVLAAKTDWDMCLMVPVYARKHLLWKQKKKILSSNPHIRIIYYNMTKINGPAWFVRTAVLRGWGLPAPRNVLVPSIAQCLRMDFKTLYIAGAEHSWIKQLWVNDNNEVMIDDKHFYDTSADAKSTVHKSAPLYKTLESIALVLQSYSKLDNLAEKKGIRIYNITPGSYIDVFERLKV